MKRRNTNTLVQRDNAKGNERTIENRVVPKTEVGDALKIDWMK